MKRRFTINVTKGYIITAIIFILGVLMLFWGLLTYLGFKKGQNALSISELNESQIKEGQYVKGVIREIAGYYEYIVYDYVFYCSPSTMILGGEPYAIQPSHPLLSPSPLAPNPSQHQSLFQVNSSHEVAKVLEFQL